MLGKTHFTVGTALTMAVTQPASISELLFAVGIGGLGSLICDIDAENSGSHSEADKITILSGLILFGVIILDSYFHTDIIQQIVNDSGYARLVIGILLFIGICAFGKEQPHRSFMHSFAALILLSFAMHLVLEDMVIYFIIGFLSHLALDIFNKKKIKLFYPLKQGIAFRFCKANGMANQILFAVGSTVLAIELLLSAVRILL